MRHFFLILLALIVSCSLYAADNAYDFLWDANPEPDMSAYKVWTWTGADTNAVKTYQYHGIFSHDSLTAIYGAGQLILVDTYLSPMNGDYLQIGVSAIDSSGNESPIGYSGYFKKVDTQAPAMVKNIGVRK